MPAWFFGGPAQTFSITTDLLAPYEAKSLEFIGHHPTRLMLEMKDLIMTVLQVTSADRFEDMFKWDVLADPVEFFGVWRGRKKMDAWSILWITVIVQGKQGTKDKKGSAVVKLKGKLKTNIPFTSVTDKMFKTINMRFFYTKQKRTYIQEGIKYIDKMEREIRSMFDLIQREEV